MPRKTSDTSSIDKVCLLIRQLGEGDGPQRLTEIARAVDLNKGTVLRVLEELTKEGFVERIEESKSYLPGPETAIFHHKHSVAVLREVARDSLRRLADAFDDTATLSVASGLDALFIERETGEFPLRPAFLEIGSRRRLGVGGGGCALLAFSPRPRADEILELVLTQLADYPLLDAARLRADLDLARQRGFAEACDHVAEGISGIAVPVLGAQGDLAAALAVSAVNERIESRRDALVDALKAEAERIHRALVARPR